MNQYVTGAVIKELREKYHFTQAELALLEEKKMIIGFIIWSMVTVIFLGIGISCRKFIGLMEFI